MMTVDRGSAILFYENCVQIAELHFTGDYGKVLLVNPTCTAIRNPRYINSLDVIRPEYRRNFDSIISKWNIDRFSIKRRS